jgi:hypothetical protein
MLWDCSRSNGLYFRGYPSNQDPIAKITVAAASTYVREVDFSPSAQVIDMAKLFTRINHAISGVLTIFGPPLV